MTGPTTRSASVCCEVSKRTSGKYLPSRAPGAALPPLHVLRESFPGAPELDVAVARTLLIRASSGEEPGSLRLYRPGRVVAFGPQDRLAPGYAAARSTAEVRGFVPIDRLTGGRAAVYHEETAALAWTIPDADARQHIRQHYETAAWLIADALRSLGVDARVGPVPGEYCPGAYSVNAGGRTKIAGIAQRVAIGATHIGAVIVAGGSEAIREVLIPVYTALGLEWDPATVGSVEDHLPVAHFDGVAEAILAAFGQEFALEESSIDAETLARAREISSAADGIKR